MPAHFFNHCNGTVSGGKGASEGASDKGNDTPSQYSSRNKVDIQITEQHTLNVLNSSMLVNLSVGELDFR